MSFRRFLSLAALAACALFVTGCLDYEEEMWINSDLSGRAVLKITLPNVLKEQFSSLQDEFTPEKIRKRFADLKGVSLVSYNLNTDTSRPVATMEVKFSSLDALSQAAAANAPAVSLIGKYDVVKDGKEIKITGNWGTAPAQGDLGEGNFAQYVIHFPEDLSYTNSTRNDGAHDTVRYNFKLEDLFNHHPNMVATLPSMIQWKFILICASVVVGVAYIAWMIWGKKTRRY